MQRILLGLIDQSWFVKTIHLCCNSCSGWVATWISWPWFVWVMKWLWAAWPLHCSVAMPLPPLLCGSCWQEDLSPEFTPHWVLQCPSRASVSSFGSAPDVTTYCLLTEGDKLTALHSRRGGEGISGSWRKTPSSPRLLCVSVMLASMGSLLFSRANTISLSQSPFTVSFVWVGCAGKKVLLWKYFVIKI